MSRFAFEIAEKYIDEWVYVDGQDPKFLRAYAKLKMLLVTIAMVDYYDESGEDYTLAMSRAWEHLQMGLKGHGTEDMSGALLLVYRLCPKRDVFLERLTEGFSRADEATGNIRRLFRKKHLEKPFRSFEEGFNLEAVIPVYGPLLREWAKMQGMNEIKAELAIEMLMRESGELKEEKPKPHLTLL